MKYIYLYTFCLISACGQDEKAEPEESSLRDELAEWYQEAKEDVGKIPSVTDCDGLLWAGLAYGANCSLPIDEFERERGVWHRRPTHDCYDKGDSRSSISTDMFAGLFAGSYYCESIERLDDIADYGSRNDFLMGVPDKPFGEAYLSVNGRAVLGQMVGRDFGKPVWKSVKPDYAKHIQSLLILLELQTSGKATKIDRVAEPKENLKRYAKEDPDDYFISAVKHMLTDGKYDDSIRLLFDSECPSYVRGDQPDKFCKAHKAFTAKVILGELDGNP